MGSASSFPVVRDPNIFMWPGHGAALFWLRPFRATRSRNGGGEDQNERAVFHDWTLEIRCVGECPERVRSRQSTLDRLGGGLRPEADASQMAVRVWLLKG